MRICVLLFISAALCGCAYNRVCVGPSISVKPQVRPEDAEFSSMEFSMVLPQGVDAVWVQYSTDRNHMDTASEKSASGKIIIRKLRQGMIYYWQIVEQLRCGVAYGRIYENLIPIVKISNRTKNPAG